MSSSPEEKEPGCLRTAAGVLLLVVAFVVCRWLFIALVQLLGWTL